MGQSQRAGGSRYITPIKASDGTSPDEHGRGLYTLTANTTYVYILGGASAPFQHVDLTGYTSAMVITTATIQATSHQVEEITDISTTVGEWKNETPAAGEAQVMSRPTSKARRLKDLIHARELLVMPGVHDPLSARLVEEAGFAAAQCSGSCTSRSRRRPTAGYAPT